MDEDNNITSDTYVVHVYKREQEAGKLHGQLDKQRQSGHHNMGPACVLGRAWMKMVFCGSTGNMPWQTGVKMKTNEVSGDRRRVKPSYLWYKPLCRGLDSLLKSHLI